MLQPFENEQVEHRPVTVGQTAYHALYHVQGEVGKIRALIFRNIRELPCRQQPVRTPQVLQGKVNNNSCHPRTQGAFTPVTEAPETLEDTDKRILQYILDPVRIGQIARSHGGQIARVTVVQLGACVTASNEPDKFPFAQSTVLS